MFYLWYIFRYFYFYLLLVLRSQNHQMDGTWVWCNFNIPDCILRLVPLFSGMWKFPQISPKNMTVGALIWSVLVTKRRNIWKRENILSKEDNHPTRGVGQSCIWIDSVYNYCKMQHNRQPVSWIKNQFISLAQKNYATTLSANYKNR